MAVIRLEWVWECVVEFSLQRVYIQHDQPEQSLAKQELGQADTVVLLPKPEDLEYFE